MIQSRICRSCNQSKPEIAFGTLKKAPDGINPVCRDCNARSGNRYYHIKTLKSKERERKDYERRISKCRAKWPVEIVRQVILYGVDELHMPLRDIAEELCISVGRVQSIKTMGISKL